MILIGTRKECFFDDFLIDKERTSARRQLHKPQVGEITMTLDCPWEGDGCDFFNFFYDEGIYRMYYLAWSVEALSSGKPVLRNERVRDIRYLESEDFENWTRPVHLDFGDKPDIPLYTNVVSPCPGAPHILVGFPTRYVERKEWTPCYEVLCGAEARKKRMEGSRRMGLAVTDCIFMTSRDGVHFTRYDEAFIRPGAEHGTNWVYGSCYPTVGIVETSSAVKADCDREWSMFCYENHMSGQATQIRRYALRQDGFCSMHAGEQEEILVTKPFVFEGKKLYANLSSSAWGYLYFELSCGGRTIRSCEMFGDSVEKEIGFEEEIEEFAGKETVLTVRLRDADLYSIRFR